VANWRVRVFFFVGLKEDEQGKKKEVSQRRVAMRDGNIDRFHPDLDETELMTSPLPPCIRYPMRAVRLENTCGASYTRHHSVRHRRWKKSLASPFQVVVSP
jgi:hypothetical protein